MPQTSRQVVRIKAVEIGAHFIETDRMWIIVTPMMEQAAMHPNTAQMVLMDTTYRLLNERRRLLPKPSVLLPTVFYASIFMLIFSLAMPTPSTRAELSFKPVAPRCENGRQETLYQIPNSVWNRRDLGLGNCHTNNVSESTNTFVKGKHLPAWERSERPMLRPDLNRLETDKLRGHLNGQKALRMTFAKRKLRRVPLNDRNNRRYAILERQRMQPLQDDSDTKTDAMELSLDDSPDMDETLPAQEEIEVHIGEPAHQDAATTEDEVFRAWLPQARQQTGKRPRSLVWTCFTLNEEKTISKCEFCTTQLTYKSATTNMLSHFKTSHLELYNNLLAQESVPNPEIDPHFPPLL
ncbi:hypothetical protein Ciccas_000857 [Cichlidogyrus casuarinus]|uniref:BED-type domain-containing protein n=1 Tax=Cichlidogyrus casuarinus TaxID=1844966 RepID=A0ABD2QLN6_9PLAT